MSYTKICLKFSSWFMNIWENSFQMCKSQYFPQDGTSRLLFGCRLHECYVQMLAKTMFSIREKGKCSHLAKGLPPGSVNTCNRSPVPQHFLLLAPATTCVHGPWTQPISLMKVSPMSLLYSVNQ